MKLVTVSSRDVGRVSPTSQRPKGKKNLLSLKRAEAGLRGFRVTTGRHFCGRESFHKNWLSTRRSDYVLHPSKLTPAVRFQFQAIAMTEDVAVARKRVWKLKPYMGYSEWECLHACVYGYVPACPF